jgi:hypothetical protein
MGTRRTKREKRSGSCSIRTPGIEPGLPASQSFAFTNTGRARVRCAPRPRYSLILEGGWEGEFLVVIQINNTNKVDERVPRVPIIKLASVTLKLQGVMNHRYGNPLRRKRKRITCSRPFGRRSRTRATQWNVISNTV